MAGTSSLGLGTGLLASVADRLQTGADREDGAAGQDAVDRRLSGLMTAAQAGDGPAYEVLLREIAVLLRRAVGARRRSLGRSDVEDLVQEILLSVHAVRATYDPQRPFLPWLMTIARNRLADGARRHGREQARAERTYDIELSLYPGASPDPGQDPQVEALKQAIEALPPRQRRAIELLKMQELTLQEVSRTTGSSAGSLKLLVHRALRNLRKTMGGT